MQYVHSCIDFISPAEHINTFHSSLSARLLIFVSNVKAVFSSLTNPYFCFCIFSWEKVFWGFFSQDSFLDILLDFPIDFFDVHSSPVVFRHSFLFAFFLFSCMELCSITETQRIWPWLPHFQLFWFNLRVRPSFFYWRHLSLFHYECVRTVPDWWMHLNVINAEDGTVAFLSFFQ